MVLGAQVDEQIALWPVAYAVVEVRQRRVVVAGELGQASQRPGK